jgi:hypothetical protein
MLYSHEDKGEGAVHNDPVVKQDHKFPWKLGGEDTDDNYHQPSGEEEEREQESYSLEQDAWLALQDNAAGEKTDFHTFWKGEGNFQTIRYAQGKKL